MIETILARAGGVNALARQLGISSAAVAVWKRVPAARVAAVARITGLPALEIRPDLVGFAETQAPFGEARALGLDPQAIAAAAVDEAVKAERARRWQAENAAAFEAKAAWLEQHGLPLARFRQF
jgi:post-segregation antitoxin (ccd killing protein)